MRLVERSKYFLLNMYFFFQSETWMICILFLQISSGNLNNKSLQLMTIKLVHKFIIIVSKNKLFMKMLLSVKHFLVDRGS